MRLNRNSAIFIALLAVVIVVSIIFLQESDEGVVTPDIEATAATIQLFPELSASGIVALTVSEQREVGDIRPTPIAGNPTLEPATPLPDDVEPETTTEIISLSKNEAGLWVADASSTSVLEGAIDSVAIENSLINLGAVLSNRQFTPSDGDYSQYGLDEPNFEITFTEQAIAETGVVTEGEAPALADPVSYRLRIGDRTIGENSYYAFLNDDSETIYVITNASTLQNSILNLTTTVPLEATPVPTLAPVLNVQAPFSAFVLTNATGFTLTSESGTVVEITRNADNTAWVYTQNGDVLAVQDEFLQIILNSFSTVSGSQQSTVEDLAPLGLDTPAYTIEARTVDGTSYLLQLGDQDPTGTFYYGLVDQFESVVFINASSVSLLLDIIENPPVLVPEATPEVTVEAEMTSEAMEATAEVEMTPEATAEVEMTEEAEMTPEATEASE